jgi:hypothetical protein
MDPESPLIHAKHVFRAAILLLAVLVAMVLGRSLFVPETWGEFGRYRGAAVTEYRNKPVRHGGDESCEMCHDVEYAAHAAGVHASVKCELCHGPVALHVDLEQGEVVAEMPIRKSRDLCELCHRRLAARPADFPQVDVREHVLENGGEMTPDACFDCHDPHSPI